MSKKVVLALGCLALLASFTTAAMADQISFGFVFAPSTIAVNASGLTVKKAVNLNVSDATTLAAFSLIGTADISTGPASSYSNAGNIVDATYTAGGAIQVDSASCVGGAMPGVCLEGVLNGNGQYTTSPGLAGSFQGLFTVTYTSPYIATLFGPSAAGFVPNSGSDGISTGHNKRTDETTATAKLGGGSITYETPVPEPGTLALLGSGMIALAGVIRRKAQ